jgi:hypothetical protein
VTLVEQPVRVDVIALSVQRTDLVVDLREPPLE